MSHCYLWSKSKTNMKKWHLENFIADNFLALNKKDPVVYLTIIILHTNRTVWIKLN